MLTMGVMRVLNAASRQSVLFAEPGGVLASRYPPAHVRDQRRCARREQLIIMNEMIWSHTSSGMAGLDDPFSTQAERLSSLESPKASFGYRLIAIVDIYASDFNDRLDALQRQEEGVRREE